jgi:precorrin-2 dehydrogenase/sirohydrochlorin ferrochelatase
MLVDLKSNDKYVVVVGAGSEGYRKTLDFVEAGAKILVVSGTFSNKVTQLGKQGKVCLQKEYVEDAKAFVDSFTPKPDVLVAVTDNHELNAQLIKAAKAAGCLVYAPDNPAISDFILPAVAKVGDVQIAISTGGRSPAMARLLRQRIEKLITPEDLLQVQMQSELRASLKTLVPNQKTRRELLYAVLEDIQVKKLLQIGKLPDAQERAKQLLQKLTAKKADKKVSSAKRTNV